MTLSLPSQSTSSSLTPTKTSQKKKKPRLSRPVKRQRKEEAQKIQDNGGNNLTEDQKQQHRLAQQWMSFRSRILKATRDVQERQEGNTPYHETEPLSSCISVTEEEDPTTTTLTSHQQQKSAPIRIITSTSWQQTPPLVPPDDIRPTTTIRIKPLLILDLNGILCHRARRNKHNDSFCTSQSPSPVVLGRVADTDVIPRPNLDDFLRLIHRHFCVAIWTSAQPNTASKILSLLLSWAFPTKSSSSSSEQTLNNSETSPSMNHSSFPFLFVWSQKQCRQQPPTKENNNQQQDAIVYSKPLQKVWKSFPLWNASNTFLWDDSPHKILEPDRKNALHPVSLAASGSDGDHDALQQQQHFLEGLAETWRRHPRQEDLTLQSFRSHQDIPKGFSAEVYDFLKEQTASHQIIWHGTVPSPEK